METPKLIFRNDDVNANSNIKDIDKIYSIIKEKFPNSSIYSCVTIFAQTNSIGKPYPDTSIRIPLRDYYSVDKIIRLDEFPYLHHLVSHGLFHCYHRGLSYETQKMSIISSCRFLNAKSFIPPFWAWDGITEQVCRDNGINLWVKPDWKNIEHEPFDPNHQYWLFHSWKHNPIDFAKLIK